MLSVTHKSLTAPTDERFGSLEARVEDIEHRLGWAGSCAVLDLMIHSREIVLFPTLRRGQRDNLASVVFPHGGPTV